MVPNRGSGHMMTLVRVCSKTIGRTRFWEISDPSLARAHEAVGAPIGLFFGMKLVDSYLLGIPKRFYDRISVLGDLVSYFWPLRPTFFGENQQKSSKFTILNQKIIQKITFSKYWAPAHVSDDFSGIIIDHTHGLDMLVNLWDHQNHNFAQILRFWGCPSDL